MTELSETLSPLAAADYCCRGGGLPVVSDGGGGVVPLFGVVDGGIVLWSEGEPGEDDVAPGGVVVSLGGGVFEGVVVSGGDAAEPPGEVDC